MVDPKHRLLPMLAATACLGNPPALAAEWSNTELHLAYGTLDIPTFAGGGDADHLVYTLQHASAWKYGGNFFFVDVLDARRPASRTSTSTASGTRTSACARSPARPPATGW